MTGERARESLRMWLWLLINSPNEIKGPPVFWQSSDHKVDIEMPTASDTFSQLCYNLELNFPVLTDTILGEISSDLSNVPEMYSDTSAIF